MFSANFAVAQSFVSHQSNVIIVLQYERIVDLSLDALRSVY